MKPAYAVYLLESEWVWDHTNREFATITVEGSEGNRWQKELECLGDPKIPSEVKESVSWHLLEIARSQNHCQMGSNPRLIRIYRVVDWSGVSLQRSSTETSPKLHLGLKLICEFDVNNKPVLPSPVVAKG